MKTALQIAAIVILIGGASATLPRLFQAKSAIQAGASPDDFPLGNDTSALIGSAVLSCLIFSASYKINQSDKVSARE